MVSLAGHLASLISVQGSGQGHRAGCGGRPATPTSRAGAVVPPRQSWATVARAAVTSSRSPATRTDRATLVAVRSAWATERHWATVRDTGSALASPDRVPDPVGECVDRRLGQTRPLWAARGSTSLSSPGSSRPKLPPLRCDTVPCACRRGPTPARPARPGCGWQARRGAEARRACRRMNTSAIAAERPAPRSSSSRSPCQASSAGAGACAPTPHSTGSGMDGDRLIRGASAPRSPVRTRTTSSTGTTRSSRRRWWSGRP